MISRSSSLRVLHSRLLSGSAHAAQASLNRVETSYRFADALKTTQEWERAKPYDAIPGDSKIGLVRAYFPGGKYRGLDFQHFIKRSREEFGDVFKVKGTFGKEDIVFLLNPEDFETVFRTAGAWPTRPGMDILNFYREHIRADVFKDAKGLVTSRGEDWAVFRKAINPILVSPNSVRLYIDPIAAVQTDLMDRIREIRDPLTNEVPGTFINEINRWAFESVVSVAVDKRLGLLKTNSDDPDAKLLFESLHNYFALLFELEMRPSLWQYFETRKYKHVIGALDNVMQIAFKYVNEGLEKFENSPRAAHKPSLFSALVQVDKQVATVMAMDMMFAGVDATSSVMSGILLALAKSPEKQEKLREEVNKALPSKESTLTIETLKNLPYLRACIKEGMRYYPLGIGNMRSTGENVVVGGYRVPEGTEVLFAMEFLLHDEKYFSRPDEYHPERWLRDEQLEGCPSACKVNSFVFLPFGYGPRTCAGKRIVSLELEMNVARLVRNFNIEFNHPTENAFVCKTMNMPNIPLKFKFEDVPN